MVTQSSSQPGFINVLNNRCPDNPFGGIVGAARLAANAQDCTNRGTDWPLVAANDDDGGGAMARDVGAGGIRDEAEVLVARKSSISLEPNSRFMNELLVI